MSAWVGDVSTTVEFSSDKWFMDRVPWALWLCVAGLALALNAAGSHGQGMGLALVYLVLLGLAFAGFAAMEKLKVSSIPYYAAIPIFVVVAVAVEFVIALTVGSSQRSGVGAMASSYWGRLINPPINVAGWLMVYLAMAWIAGSVYRHFYPSKSALMLSPRGVGLHFAWLKDVLIPWREITATSGPGCQGLLGNKHLVAVEIPQRVYERDIAPKLSVLAPPGAGGLFHPNGEAMTLVLTTSERVSDVEAARVGVAERWRAYRDWAPAAMLAPKDARVVVGRWSLEPSAWQTGMFSAPLVVMAVVVVHAAV